MYFLRPIVMIIFVLWGTIANAADSLLFADILSTKYFEHLDNKNQIRLNSSLKSGKAECRSIMNLNAGPMKLYLRHEFSRKNFPEPVYSVKLSLPFVTAGRGKGYVRAGNGVIMGNTMMGFGSDPRGNFKPGLSGCKISNNNYYRNLQFCGTNFEKINLNLFRQDSCSGFLGTWEDNKIKAGTAVYYENKIIEEIWFKHSFKNLSFSANVSVNITRFNHISADIYFRHDAIKCHAAFIRTGTSFCEIRSDSRWGSGLERSATGFMGGFKIQSRPFSLSETCRLLHMEYRMYSRSYLNAEYSDKSFALQAVLRHDHTGDLLNAPAFPYPLAESIRDITLLKIIAELKISESMDLITGIYSGLSGGNAAAFISKIKYANKNDLKIVLQYIYGCSGKEDIYILRPTAGRGSLIQKLDHNTTNYLDLTVMKKLKEFKFSASLSNSGDLRLDISRSLRP